VGECRAGEALDMIQAMTTGQEGSLSTGHANTPEDMLRRLETMILMTGYELPMRAIREQIASAVDVIVHTARLRDGSRKIVSITEVLGTEDDDILTQEVFAFVQTGFHDGKVEGSLRPTGIRPTFMRAFKVRGIHLPPGEFGIPPEDPSQPPARVGKSRWAPSLVSQPVEEVASVLGLGRSVVAGGMVYLSSVGPVDPETGRVLSGEIRAQARQCLANLRTCLEEAGSSLEKVVWANWSLRDATEFDAFYQEWLRCFPDEAPVGQGTLLPLAQRRAGFRVSVGVIASL
jgi:enamine deaminase RidA (YjgF/YER057c/UK114 family)